MNAYRECWRLAWPLILSNLSVPLLGMVDTAVVGHLPEPHHLGAVALGALVMSAIYFVYGFLRMGTTGLAAQAFGAGDADEMRAVLVRAAALAIVLGLAALAFSVPIGRAALALFAPTGRVGEQFLVYLHIRLFGAPAALVNFVLLGWLLGLQDSRGPLMLLMFTNTINAVLDLVLVLGFGFAAGGVALATVIAEYAGTGLGLWLAVRALRRIGGRLRRERLFATAPFRRLLLVNRDIFLRSLSLEAAAVVFTALSSRQGELVLAGNAVLLNFLRLSAYGLDGFAFAAEALVGRRVGAGDREGFRAATRAAAVWSAALAMLVVLAFATGGPLLIRLLTGIAEVRAIARTFLPYVAISPLIAVWAFLFDGVFIGATRTAELRNGMAVALLVFLAGAGLLVPPFGNHGLWMAHLAFYTARGLYLGLAFSRIERGPGFVAAD